MSPVGLGMIIGLVFLLGAPTVALLVSIAKFKANAKLERDIKNVF